ncbi:MAG: carbohydrate binding domain-containing protein, partial [Chitinispirillaceae bacterium]|nr:carbohydrate binding domain-containing protein [Chitinispirillaceae bacterium]
MRLFFTILFLSVFVSFSQNSTSENLIKNGDFSDSSLVGWNFNSNGFNAKWSVDGGRFLITIENQPRREALPQLIQRNIALRSGEGYRLSFKASSSDTGFITVKFDGRSKIIYTDTSSLSVRVLTNATIYTIDFFVEEGDNNSTLIFSFGVNTVPSRIAIDSISLTLSSVPMIKIISPSVGTKWIAGTERQIQWLNSGKLEIIKIKYSPDGGLSWNVITSAATNKKSYWWKIPTGLSGDKFLIVVSDTLEKIADTSEMFKIVSGNSIDVKEMVKNGDFLDTTGWRFSVNGNAKAKGSFIDDKDMENLVNWWSKNWDTNSNQEVIAEE